MQQKDSTKQNVFPVSHEQEEDHFRVFLCLHHDREEIFHSY